MKNRAPVLIALMIAIAALCPPSRLAAQNLDRPEIESTKDRQVEFVNYEGPQSRIDSLAEIKGIGSALGAARDAGAKRPGDPGRYAVIHAVDPATPEGFDADILVLGPGAQVDHIRNLRWIIAAYLSSAWGYAEKDAYLLATFVTIYNAVHRGDMKYVESKYKAVVRKEVSAANVGLSKLYNEWPGRSRILIPLSSGARKGSLGAVDTKIVGGKDVTEQLRKEEGKGIEDRQSMTDLKEREAAEKQAEADKKQAEADKAADEAAAAAKQAAAERAKLEEEKAKAGPEQQAELAEREKDVKAEEEAAAKKQTEAAEKQAEADKAQVAADEKKSEAASDRKDIAQDQKAAIAEDVAQKALGETAGVNLLQVVDPVYPFARIVFVDSRDGKLIRASKINSLRGRTVVDAGDSFVGAAGRVGGNAVVRLVRVDKASLEVVAEGRVDLFPETAVWKFGERYYAVAMAGSGGGYNLVRFDRDLKEQARSTSKVDPFTFLVEAAGGLAVQVPGGSFVVLVPDSLERIKDLKP